MIKKRIDQAKILHIGVTAPNIILPDSEGNSYDMSKIKSGKTLVIFYASWCPHCKEMLPKINELVSQPKNKSVTVLAISLDTKKEDWLSFIQTNTANFVNLSDLKGWDSEATSGYFLYATPTMFLLDAEKKIIGKPTNLEEVRGLF